MCKKKHARDECLERKISLTQTQLESDKRARTTWKHLEKERKVSLKEKNITYKYIHNISEIFAF